MLPSKPDNTELAQISKETRMFFKGQEVFIAVRRRHSHILERRPNLNNDGDDELPRRRLLPHPDHPATQNARVLAEEGRSASNQQHFDERRSFKEKLTTGIILHAMDGQFEPDEGTRRSMMKKSTFAESDEGAMLEAFFNYFNDAIKSQSHSDLPPDVVDRIKLAVPKYLMQNHRSLAADLISEIRNDFTESSKSSAENALKVSGNFKEMAHQIEYMEQVKSEELPALFDELGKCYVSMAEPQNIYPREPQSDIGQHESLKERRSKFEMELEEITKQDEELADIGDLDKMPFYIKKVQTFAEQLQTAAETVASFNKEEHLFDFSLEEEISENLSARLSNYDNLL
ncbi:hypothetical protein HK405_010109 [Cladochytrium tenue]|nr:hypothetical protein HK405_010109 [Cladochytrium tenue]